MLAYWVVKGILSLGVFDNFNISDGAISGIQLIVSYINAFSSFINVSLIFKLTFVFIQSFLYCLLCKFIIDFVKNR